MIRTVIMSIDPDIAKTMLGHNTANRQIRSTWVSFLASEMASGRWQLTHQGIAFNTNGELVDGQHRLLAIIKSSVTVKMEVTYDLSTETFPMIDVMIKRSTADIMHTTDAAVTKRDTEVAQLVYELGKPDFRHKASPETIYPIYKQLAASIAIINQSTDAKVKIWSSAPFRTAAVVAVYTGNPGEWVTEFYANLVHQNISLLPKSATILMKYEQQHPNNAGYDSRYQRYIRARYAFTYQNKDNVAMRVTDTYLEKCAAEIAEIIGGINEKAAK